MTITWTKKSSGVWECGTARARKDGQRWVLEIVAFKDWTGPIREVRVEVGEFRTLSEARHSCSAVAAEWPGLFSGYMTKTEFKAVGGTAVVGADR